MPSIMSLFKNYEINSEDDIPTKYRAEIEEKDPFERRKNFDHVELSMTYEEAMREAGRCLRCDHHGCGVMEGGRGE